MGDTADWDFDNFHADNFDDAEDQAYEGMVYGRAALGKSAVVMRGSDDKTWEAYWVTQTGEIILVKDMDTGHLINTIRLIERGDAPDRKAYIPVLQEELDRRSENANRWRKY